MLGAPGRAAFLGQPAVDGGDAVVLNDGSRALLLDSVLAGGAGGPGFHAGEPLVVNDNAVRVSPLHARSLSATSPVREGALFQLRIAGVAGDLVRLYASSVPSTAVPLRTGARFSVPRSGLAGTFQLPHAASLVLVTTLPIGGELVLSAPAPAFAPAHEADVYFLQALVRDAASGRFVVSTPSSLVVLDDAL